MKDKKDDITQINKYLKGKLDARAMHKLERQAQDDPFLMDALEGYEAVGEQDANLSELKELLNKRVAPKKERNIILWRVLPIAACLLIALMAGYWYFVPRPLKQQYAALTKPGKTVIQPIKPPVRVITEQKKLTAKTPVVVKQQPIVQAPSQSNLSASAPAIAQAKMQITYKTDTVEYKASDYQVRQNTNVTDLIKHMEGFRVDSNGGITHQGQAVTKARLNGKDYAGGNIQQAVKALPADIVEKIQVVDDYGDQAAKTGVKNGSPSKVLNITTDTINRRLIATNRAADPDKALHEVNINDKSLPQTTNTGVVNALQGKVAGLSVNQPVPAIVATRTITGSIVDNKGEPLIGASVTVKGKQQSTQTSVDGTFSITVPATDETLDVQYIGYTSQQIKIGNQNNLKIALDANQTSLSEVVVVGYGAQKKRDITGSVSSVNAQPKNLSDTISAKNAHPAIGIKAYDQYLKENAIVTDGKTGTVKLIFTVSPTGAVSNIRIEKGINDELNQKAINLILNGPKWIGENKSKNIRLKITFHK